MRQVYYLDHNAASPILPAVAAAMQGFLEEPWGNPSSVHQAGQHARGLIERARRTLEETCGFPPGGTLIFTSGATESNAMILSGWQGVGAIVSSPLEHPSVRLLLTEMASEKRREVRWVRHDEHGRIDLEHLASLLPGAGLVSLMWANNELGNWNDIGAIGALCQRAGVLFHSDAAQVLGRYASRPLLGIDALTLSAHKAGGPSGIGALWLKNKSICPPLYIGGHQERGKRPGTENLLAICGWEALLRSQSPYDWDNLASIRDTLESALVERCGAVVNGDRERRMAHTANLSFPGIEAEALVMALDLSGVAVSTGSACTAGSVEVSPVLDVLGVANERVNSAIRISLGPGIIADDISEILARFQRLCTRLRT